VSIFTGDASGSFTFSISEGLSRSFLPLLSDMARNAGLGGEKDGLVTVKDDEKVEDNHANSLGMWYLYLRKWTYARKIYENLPSVRVSTGLGM
jgi:hypothetical protein